MTENGDPKENAIAERVKNAIQQSGSAGNGGPAFLYDKFVHYLIKGDLKR